MKGSGLAFFSIIHRSGYSKVWHSWHFNLTYCRRTHGIPVLTIQAQMFLCYLSVLSQVFWLPCLDYSMGKEALLYHFCCWLKTLLQESVFCKVMSGLQLSTKTLLQESVFCKVMPGLQFSAKTLLQESVFCKVMPGLQFSAKTLLQESALQCHPWSSALS